MYRNQIFIFILCVGVYQSDAQVLQSHRYEVQLNQHDINFDVIPSGRNIYLTRLIQAGRHEALEVVSLDSVLSERWKGYVSLEPNYVLIARKSFSGKLYVLLRYMNFTKKDFILVVISPDGTFTKQIIKGYIPFAPTDFEVTSQAVLIAGYYSRVPLVLYFSLGKLSSIVLPGSFTNIGEITHLKVYDDDTFDILISALNERRHRTIMIKSYSPDGSLLQTTSLDPGERNLIFGRAIKRGTDHVIAGVYGSRSTEYSHGIFVANLKDDRIDNIRYYHFGDLQNFFKFMRAKREKRVKERIERRKVQGKKIRLHYRFLVHEFLVHEDQYILLGEAFYPKYRNVDGASTILGLRGGLTQNGRIFDGYQYTHAVVIGFSDSGEFLWDNSFEINDIKTFKLEQFVKIQADNEEIALLYLFDNKIRTKIIQNDEVLEGKTAESISTGATDEVISRIGSEDIGRIDYWYGKHMVAFGTQEIEKKYSRAATRRVFFINKIKLFGFD